MQGDHGDRDRARPDGPAWLGRVRALPRGWRWLGMAAALAAGAAAWAVELGAAPTSVGLLPWISLFLLPAWWLLFSERREALWDLARVPFWWLVFCAVGWLSVARTGLEPRWSRLPPYALVQLGTLGPMLVLRHLIGAWLTRRRGPRRGWRLWLRQLGVDALLIFLWLPVIMLSINLHRAQAAAPAPAGTVRLEFAGAGGTPLVGLWMPQPQPKGALLLVHGIGAEKTQFLDAVAELRDQGYAVMSFDQRNHGESSGLTVTLGAVESRDVVAAWQQLLDRTRGLDLPRVLLGISLGGAAAQLAAPDCEGLDALVLDSTFARAEAIAARAVPWPWLAERTMFIAHLADLLVTGHHALAVAPVEAAERLDAGVRVRIVHAREDPLIPFDQARELMQRYGAAHATTLTALPGRHHARGHVVEPALYRSALRELAAEVARDRTR